MTFVSYAQNYEDVMLHRALRNIAGGFYVDVGAEHPVNDSVTKAFYQRGWSGINLEPVPHWFDLISRDRPRDINLNVAVGEEAGALKFYSVAETGLSTACEEYAERYRQEGRDVTAMEVSVVTLTSVLEEHAPGEIHFLKVDVEGFERQVLAGLDLRRFRPWILVVESTLPNSNEERFSDWEPMVSGSEYEFVYFDGLNRFYVAKEHAELSSHFRVPPNILDDFIRRPEWQARNEAREAGRLLQATEANLATMQSVLEGTQRRFEMIQGVLGGKDREISWLRGRIDTLNEANAWLHGEKEFAHEQLHALTSSISWRSTAPLRYMNRWRHRLTSWLRILVRSPIIALKMVLRFFVRRLARVESAKRLGALLLKRSPALKGRLVRAIVGMPSPSGVNEHVSRSARRFLTLFERLLDPRKLEKN